MTDKTIFIFDAQEGDKLADDVHTPDGNILAKKDTILNYDIIANISGHHILEVKVYDTNNAVSYTHLDVYKRQYCRRVMLNEGRYTFLYKK